MAHGLILARKVDGGGEIGRDQSLEVKSGGLRLAEERWDHIEVIYTPGLGLKGEEERWEVEKQGIIIPEPL